MTKPKWIEKVKKNIIKHNNSLTPEERVKSASKAGRASWAKLTIEQKADRLRKMRVGRK